MNGKDPDEDQIDEPPCMCAQQLVSTMFGTLLGYMSLLLCRATVIVAICQGLGVVFGLLGSEPSTMRNIFHKEPLIFICATLCLTYLCLHLCGGYQSLDLGTLAFTSFLLSYVAALGKMMLNMYQISSGGPYSKLHRAKQHVEDSATV